MVSVKETFAVRLKQAAVIVGSTAGIILLSTGASFASSGPAFYPGETVDVFTNSFNGHTGFTISLFSDSGGSFNTKVPLTYIGNITGNFTPAFATNYGLTWGTTWYEFSFQMPKGETGGHTYGALMNTSTGGSVFTRFVGYPDPSQSTYGTQYTYESPVAPPTGQAPEVPYAAALPLVAAGIWGILQFRRHRVAGLS